MMPYFSLREMLFYRAVFIRIASHICCQMFEAHGVAATKRIPP